MPVPLEIVHDPRERPRPHPLCARTGSRPPTPRAQAVVSHARVASPPLAFPPGRDPASHGRLRPTAGRCYPHRSAAREAALFNQALKGPAPCAVLFFCPARGSLS